MFDYKHIRLWKVVSLYVFFFLGCSVSRETRDVTIILWKPKVTFADFQAVKATYSNCLCEHDDKNYLKFRIKLPLADARSHEEIENEIVHMLSLLKSKDASKSGESSGESSSDKEAPRPIKTFRIFEVRFWYPKVTADQLNAVRKEYEFSTCEHYDGNLDIDIKLPIDDRSSSEEINENLSQILDEVDSRHPSDDPMPEFYQGYMSGMQKSLVERDFRQIRDEFRRFHPLCVIHLEPLGDYEDSVVLHYGFPEEVEFTSEMDAFIERLRKDYGD